MAETPDWFTGEHLGLEIPTHPDALREGGPDYLTTALRACGVLGAAGRVSAVTGLQEVPGGSTGRKLRLSVEYRGATAGLERELFVKFSRHLGHPLRDRARFQMEREVRFALLSRDPAFPIRVPACYAADFHSASGTGFLVTSRVPFGRGGVEPQREKCRDDEMLDSQPYYRALVVALARLAGTQRSGRLGEGLERQFPYDPAALAVSRREPYSPEQVSRRVVRLATFVRDYPQLLPAPACEPGFIERLRGEAPALAREGAAIEAHLAAQSDYLALCHWNANIDNAWFWRDGAGEIVCGLLDWGNVSVMPLAMALWGCLSGAGAGLWDDHLEELLDLFAREYLQSGGPQVDPGELQRQLLLHVRLVGINWLLDVPASLQKLVGELRGLHGPHDPRIREHEAARTQLQMLSVFLNQWATRDPGAFPGSAVK